MISNIAIYNRKIIAELLNLSEKRIRQLTQEGVIEEYSTGFYKLVSAVQGYVKYILRQISDDDQTSNYNTEKARLTKAKREDAELDLKTKKNELHRSGDVEFVMTNMLVAFKSKLEVLPHKVLPDIVSIPDGKEKADGITAVIKSALDEALNELAGYDPELFEEAEYMTMFEDDLEEDIISDS